MAKDILMTTKYDKSGEEHYVLLSDYVKLQNVLKRVALSIDWDEQNASRFYIGEDAAASVLWEFGFPWERGVCNEEVEKFLNEQSKT